MLSIQGRTCTSPLRPAPSVHAAAALQDFSYSIHMFLVALFYNFFTPVVPSGLASVPALTAFSVTEEVP